MSQQRREVESGLGCGHANQLPHARSTLLPSVNPEQLVHRAQWGCAILPFEVISWTLTALSLSMNVLGLGQLHQRHPLSAAKARGARQ